MNPIRRINKGAWPVLLTPFTEKNKLDLEALEELIEFYIQAGVGGIFPVCLSGEVFHLSMQEKINISYKCAETAKGRISVVAGGNFGDTLEEQADTINRISETGVDAVVALISILPSAENLAEQLIRLAQMTSVPLGVYECPCPEHRILTPEDVRKISKTQRFIFMKETSCDIKLYGQKLQAAQGSPLLVFQANLSNLPRSLELGSPGTCGVIVNVCPELSAAFCDPQTIDSQVRKDIFNSLVAIHDIMTTHVYPVAAKYILQKRGLKLTTVTRCVDMKNFKEEDRQIIDKFLTDFDFTKPSISDAKLKNLTKN
jgi:4-hydroxy-tetrahydrodipicolinate synthase